MTRRYTISDTPEIPPGHALAETRVLKPNDLRLRRNGFIIHSRPKSGPALWRLREKVYTELEALMLCEEE